MQRLRRIQFSHRVHVSRLIICILQIEYFNEIADYQLLPKTSLRNKKMLVYRQRRCSKRNDYSLCVQILFLLSMVKIRPLAC